MTNSSSVRDNAKSGRVRVSTMQPIESTLDLQVLYSPGESAFNRPEGEAQQPYGLWLLRNYPAKPSVGPRQQPPA